MIGAPRPPPGCGSPLRRRCSSISRERRLESRRGAGAAGLRIGSTRPLSRDSEQAEAEPSAEIAEAAVVWRPLGASRAASQISSPARARSTACNTSSRLKAAFSSAMTTTGGAPGGDPDEIAAADFALAGEAKALQKGFHRRVEGGFPQGGFLPNRRQGSPCLCRSGGAQAFMLTAALASGGAYPQKALGDEGIRRACRKRSTRSV